MSGFKVLAITFVSASLLVASAVAVMAADGSPLPKPAVPDGNATVSKSKPMIIKNPGGTFTVQKEPPNGNSKDAKVKDGLVIPPQVIVPEITASKRKD